MKALVLGTKKKLMNRHGAYVPYSAITHQDVGQMDMYIRMYDELKKREDDNPTLGIVLCADTDEDIARYSVLHGNEQLFASKYKLYLPSEEELRAEIKTQKEFYIFRRKIRLNPGYYNMCTKGALPIVPACRDTPVPFCADCR